MKIQTLKDIKKALNEIPDNVLSVFGAGVHFEGSGDVEILCWDNENGIDDEIHNIEYYSENVKNHPLLIDVIDWIKCIIKEQKLIMEDPTLDTAYGQAIAERTEPISSEDWVKCKHKELIATEEYGIEECKLCGEEFDTTDPSTLNEDGTAKTEHKKQWDERYRGRK